MVTCPAVNITKELSSRSVLLSCFLHFARRGRFATLSQRIVLSSTLSFCVDLRLANTWLKHRDDLISGHAKAFSELDVAMLVCFFACSDAPHRCVLFAGRSCSHLAVVFFC